MLGWFQLELVKNSIQWEGGYVIPPSEPDLGIDVVLAHPYTGNELHLDMSHDAREPLAG